MTLENLQKILKDVACPAYICDEGKLEKNFQHAKYIADKSGAKIILALKGFALIGAFDLAKKYLSGTTASGEHEAKLGAEFFSGGEIHVYSPAFTKSEIDEIIKLADKSSIHLSFNSASQFEKYFDYVKSKNSKISMGMRLNPKISQVTNSSLYDPCAPCSRMGALIEEVPASTQAKLEGVHFHALCENMAEASVALIEKVEQDFEELLHQVKWVNFGGGHYINHKNYDAEKLIKKVQEFKKKFDIEVIFEPGGALAYESGWLVSEVLDVVKNEKEIAILDTSATAHMPDVLELPYRPMIIGSGEAGEKKHSYIVAGRTCLTGDVIGEYSFDAEPKAGDKLIFTDMMQYSFVKNSTFNGIPLPDLGMLKKDGSYVVLKKFGYDDFKKKLG